MPRRSPSLSVAIMYWMQGCPFCERRERDALLVQSGIEELAETLARSLDPEERETVEEEAALLAHLLDRIIERSAISA